MMKIPYPLWKWFVVLLLVVTAVQGVEMVLGVEWPEDEPYWKCQVFVLGEMFIGVALAYMMIQNSLTKKFNRKNELKDAEAKMNLLFRVDYTKYNPEAHDAGQNEDGGTAGSSDG